MRSFMQYTVLLGTIAVAAAASARIGQQHDMGEMGSMTMNGGAMAAHMIFTPARPVRPGDQARADAIAAAAKAAIAPYADSRKAEAEGFHIFLPHLPQKIYHFTNYNNGFMEAQQFDPARPTSLLYEKTPSGAFKLVGAMYTDRVGAPEWELNDRVPLSIARWHQHVNFCQAPEGQEAGYVGKNARFGLLGSILTRKDCDAAGGTFQSHLFGWMVHVYPFETDAKKVWATDRDDDGQMKGMKM